MTRTLHQNLELLMKLGAEIIDIDFKDITGSCGDPDCCGSSYELMATEIRFPGEATSRTFTDDSTFELAVHSLLEYLQE